MTLDWIVTSLVAVSASGLFPGWRLADDVRQEKRRLEASLRRIDEVEAKEKEMTKVTRRDLTLSELHMGLPPVGLPPAPPYEEVPNPHPDPPTPPVAPKKPKKRWRTVQHIAVGSSDIYGNPMPGSVGYLLEVLSELDPKAEVFDGEGRILMKLQISTTSEPPPHVEERR